MGQKVNPIGFRVGVDHDWRSRWFADKRSFGDFLAEDCVLRDAVAKALKEGAVSEVRIERYANRVRLNIHTARPGIVRGKGRNVTANSVRATLPIICFVLFIICLLSLSSLAAVFLL